MNIDNLQKLEKTITKEYESMKTGDMYIENCSDALTFISHLLFLVTDGRQGEEREFLYED